MKDGVMDTSSTAAAALRLSETKGRFPPKSPRDNVTCCKCKGPNHMAKDHLSQQKTNKKEKKMREQGPHHADCSFHILGSSQGRGSKVPECQSIDPTSISWQSGKSPTTNKSTT